MKGYAAPPGNRFVSFVNASERAGGAREINSGYLDQFLGVVVIHSPVVAWPKDHSFFHQSHFQVVNYTMPNIFLMKTKCFLYFNTDNQLFDTISKESGTQNAQNVCFNHFLKHSTIQL